MTKVAIIGPGAIGGTLAAWLAANASNKVSVCVRTPFDNLVVHSPFGTLSPFLQIWTTPQQAEPVDWVIIACKTYQLEDCATWLKQLCNDATRIAVVQNGVEHVANVTPYFEPEKVVPVIIDCPAERTSPGRVVQRGRIDMAVPNQSTSAEFAALFDHSSISIELTDDWTTAAWKKLCTNSSGAICALINQPANIARDMVAANVMRNLIGECIVVGRAEGAVIGDEIIEEVIKSQTNAPEGAMNSIHADLVAKRPLEWRARNGVIARLGKKHGIPTPYNQLATELLSLIEKSYAN